MQRETYIIDMFTGPHGNFSVFQDMRFHADVLAQRAKAADKYSRQLEKVKKNIDGYITDARRKTGNCPDTVHFLAALEGTMSELVNQVQAATEDAGRFQKMSNSLEEYTDDPHLRKNVKVEQLAFESLKSSFYMDQQDLNEAKSKYNKAMMQKEVVEIKELLAKTESRLDDLEEREDRLKEKVQKTKDDYKLAVGTANATLQHLDSASIAYKDAWFPIAEKRAKFITESLSQCAVDTAAVKGHLGKIDFARLISSLELTEKVAPPRFQEYRCTEGKAALNAKSGKPHQKIKAVVTEDFEKYEQNQLNLKRGQKIKQLLPANSLGLAFGEKSGNFGKKKRGFFPAGHVRLLE